MARYSARARQKEYTRKMRDLRQARKTGVLPPSLTRAPAVNATVEATTVFVWPRMGLRCGIAEYVKHLAAVSKNSAYCRLSGQIRRADHVVLVLMPSLNEPIASLVAFIRRMRSSGTRVTLDIHHLTVGQNLFAPLIKEANDTVWHLPSMPRLGGGGRYVPLPVPVLPQPEVARVGGLAHFGLGHESKRIPVMAGVAHELDTTLYIYGDRNQQFVPAALAAHVSVSDAYPSDAELSRLLRQHDVGLIGRARWSTEVQLNGSASARFFAGVGLPAVLDQAPAHEDLVEVFDVVPFEDFSQVVARTRLLVENADYRAEAVEKLRQYARVASPQRVAEQMNIEVK